MLSWTFRMSGRSQNESGHRGRSQHLAGNDVANLITVLFVTSQRAIVILTHFFCQVEQAEEKKTQVKCFFMQEKKNLLFEWQHKIKTPPKKKTLVKFQNFKGSCTKWFHHLMSEFSVACVQKTNRKIWHITGSSLCGGKIPM